MSRNKKKSSPLAVIDLTSSFTLAEPCASPGTIIDLASDESFDSSVKIITPKKHGSNDSTTSVSTEKTSKVSSKKRKITPKSAGACPICLEELGKSPLYSTKCGHVFCQYCLEQSLALEKRCPTCRQALKGKTAYHPLYLPIEN